MGSIERMFDPETVAVIGATERERSVGRAIMENLISWREGDFPRKPESREGSGAEMLSEHKGCAEARGSRDSGRPCKDSSEGRRGVR